MRCHSNMRPRLLLVGSSAERCAMRLRWAARGHRCPGFQSLYDAMRAAGGCARGGRVGRAHLARSYGPRADRRGVKPYKGRNQTNKQTNKSANARPDPHRFNGRARTARPGCPVVCCPLSAAGRVARQPRRCRSQPAGVRCRPARLPACLPGWDGMRGLAAAIRRLQLDVVTLCRVVRAELRIGAPNTSNCLSYGERCMYPVSAPAVWSQLC